MSLIAQIINRLYHRPYLLMTNTVTGVLSISIGDVLQQNLENHWTNNNKNFDNVIGDEQNSTKRFQWDQKRTRNMMFAGVYFSLFGHWWYSFLDRKFPPNQKRSVKKKLLAESAMGPFLVSSVFILFGRINGNGFEKMLSNIKSNFTLICLVEWFVFVPVQYINFRFVPSSFRYLYVATFSIGYDAFLSYVLHRNDRLRQRKRLKNESIFD
ncbi:Mpv17-like protein 2 [Sarcoptes scabiei]|uniref:Mpv17-like protein 2 n=1 Tax=Sarcoptes scabiei TaxID=52283 RepID=A0A834REI1_SARSC|nr:Mpv17-like protein 2 [Sarcoptes scabiei]